jgi:hypothetical protein
MAYGPGSGGGPGAQDNFTNQSAVVAPGFHVCLRGSNFGDAQGIGYMRLTDRANGWGAPNDSASLQIQVWRSDFIEFVMPSSAIDVSMLQANSIASVVVVNSMGLTSGSVQLKIVKIPVINSVTPQKGGPGTVVTLTGQNLGSFGPPAVHFMNNGFDWRAYPPGTTYVPKQYALTILGWNDSQVQFLVPSDRPANPGWPAIAPGSTANVEIANQAGVSNVVSLSLTTGVRWPVSAYSGVANIGGTGAGHMETWVSIDNVGNLSGTTHTWDTDNPFGIFGFVTGFHGAVVVRLLDVNNNTISPDFTAGPYGVEGGDSRYDNWAATLTQDQRDRLYSIAICNFYDPQWNAAGAIVEWIAGHKDEIIATATVVVTIAGMV